MEAGVRLAGVTLGGVDDGTEDVGVRLSGVDDDVEGVAVRSDRMVDVTLHGSGVR